MRCYWLPLGVLLVLSAVLGAVSAWTPDGAFRGVPLVLFNTLVLFVVMSVFLILLPKWLTLPMQILVAMVSGAIAGWAFSAVGEVQFVSDYVNIFGRLFVLLLKLVIAPLIFVSIVCGVAGIGDVRKLGPIGAKTIAFYLTTTAMAVLLGIVLVNALQPGSGRGDLRAGIQDASDVGAAASPSTGRWIQDEALPKYIQDPLFPGRDPIAIILFALLLGAALAALGPEGASAVGVFRAFDRAFIMIVLWIMALAPLGVFALMAEAIGTLGIEYVLMLAKYFFTVVFGLATHFCVLVFVVCPLLARISPMRFLRGMAPAFQVGFSTSSSSAALPVSIDCVTKRVGADESIASFMLPIGATINMDGTALYTAVASIFIAQVYGIQLGPHAQFAVFATAVVVSIGTAGIPGGSIALMSIILVAAGIPVEGIGIILGVDRFLDMCRTVVNMCGDSVGAVVVSRSEGLLCEPSEAEARP